MNRLTLLAGTALLLLAPCLATAGTSQSAAQILKDQRELRARLDKPAGEYGRFSSDAIAQMQRAQDRVFRMLDGVKSLDELNDYQKTELSNALDEVKAVLLANDANRQVCRRERKTGSNVIQLRCETLAERKARMSEAQDVMREAGPRAQLQHGG